MSRNLASSPLLIRTVASLALAAGVAMSAYRASADDPKDSSFTVSEGRIKLPLPAGWVRKQPRSNIIEHEFAVPAKEGDAADGRITVMGAGGSVQDNIDRWCGQFKQPDGSNTSDKAKISQKQVSGQQVHVVDIRGTYEDKAGPFVPGPGAMRENYRMLGAILVTKDAGTYYLKFYGPDRLVTEQEAAFNKVVDGIEVK